MQIITYVFSICIGLLAGPLLAISLARPAPGQPVLVVVAPWQDVTPVFEMAGATQIGPLPAHFAGFATLDRAGFARSMRQAGAWFVVRSDIGQFLCGDFS